MVQEGIMNGIDYHALAERSDRTGESFCRLAELAERGDRLPPIPDGEWVDSRTATDLLSADYGHGLALLKGSSVSWRSRSLKNPKARRGKAGGLYLVADLERVQTIRRQCRIGLQSALRVFDALKDGRI